MDAHTVATDFLQRLHNTGISASVQKPIQYGLKLAIAGYSCNLYAGKKGLSLVFEGRWPDDLKAQVEALWDGKAISPSAPSRSMTPRAAQPASPRHPEAVVLYVDGAYRETPAGPRIGWAFEAWLDGRPVYHQAGVLVGEHLLSLRNIAGECHAVARALSWAADCGHKQVEIRYDYAGLEAWATGAWQAKQPFTRQYACLVRQMLRLISITWTKVQGHSGEPGNERVDRLAAHAIETA